MTQKYIFNPTTNEMEYAPGFDANSPKSV